MDIKGKKFKAVGFESDSRLSCNNYYNKVIDSNSIGTIIGPHRGFPEYINVKFTNITGVSVPIEIHFPVKVVMDQLQQSPGYESSLFKEILKLIKQVSK